MPMVKTGVVSKNKIDVVGVSADDGAYICEGCSKIVLSKQIKKDEICPFCQSDKLIEENIKS